MTALRQSVRVGAVANLAGLIGQKVFAMGSMILLVRGLSVSDYGLYSLFLAAVVLLANLTFGLDKIVQRYYPQLLSGTPSQAVTLLLVFLAKRLLLLLFLVGLLVLVAKSGLIDMQRLNISHPLWVVGLGIVMAVRQMLTLALNAAHMEHPFLNVVIVSTDLLRFLLFLTLWDQGLGQAIAIWSVGELMISVAIIIRMLWRIRSSGAGLRLTGAWLDLDYGRYYHYGKYFLFASFGTYVLSVETDYYFLSYYLGEEAVGSYAFAAKLPILLLMLAPSQLLFNVALPLMIRRQDEGTGLTASADRIGTFVKVNLVVWTLFAGGLISCLELIVAGVFDEKYMNTLGYIQWWLLIFYLVVLKGVFEPLARAMEYSRIYLFTFAAALINIIGDALLVPMFGMNGALVATAAAITFQGVGISLAVARRLGLSIAFGPALSMLARIAVAFATAVWLQGVAGPDVGAQILSATCFLLVSTGLFWPMFWLRSVERSWLLGFIRRPAGVTR